MFNIFSKKEGEVKSSSIVWGDGQAVLSAISDGVMALDSSGNIRIINSAAEQILGWTSGDSSNLSFESVFLLTDSDGKPFERESNPIRRALLSFESFSSRELFLKTQNGKNFPIFLQINPMDERRSGLVVVFRNITKEIEENRQQTEFISTASHEMRTPVASIEGYLGLCLNPATATIDNRARGFLEKAYENTRHLGQLFQDLLDISKSEDGRLKNEPVVLDAVEFARNIWDGLREKAAGKNLDFIFELDQNKSGGKTLLPVYYIHSDRDHLHEVLDNLFENAIKYTPSGRVSVNVSGDNENVWISVADSGIGIPAEDIPHLFQKFYRVDNSETREIGGTGLGLYLSRRLVESMGGKLSLESEYKKGSTFTVQLPRITREQAEKLKAQESQKVEKEDRKDEIFENAKEIFEAKMVEDLKTEEAQKGEEVEFLNNLAGGSVSNSEISKEEVASAEIQIQKAAQVQQENEAPVQATRQNTIIQQVQQIQQVPQTQPQANYAEQEGTIREYQMRQYYARQKAADDAWIRAEQANLARDQQMVQVQQVSHPAQALARPTQQIPQQEPAQTLVQPTQRTWQITQQIQPQNPYFPQNQSQAVQNFGSAVNYSPPAQQAQVSNQGSPSNSAYGQISNSAQSSNDANIQQKSNIQSTQIPTLSDIEKMREQYVQRMMAERQNSQ